VKPTVLFACVHNAGRSQIAAALFNHVADPSKATAISAGTQPGAAIHPEVLGAMREIGIDLTPARPTLLTAEIAGRAAVLVTMGCGEACPVVPSARREDWAARRPEGEIARGGPPHPGRNREESRAPRRRGRLVANDLTGAGRRNRPNACVLRRRSPSSRAGGR
jgi:arsenate reductase (thioredoxin)